MALNATQLRNLERRDKPYKLHDARGLFLQVPPTGTPRWRFRYKLAGREKLLALGTLDEVSLAQARKARDAARDLVREGRDPSAERQARKHARGGDDSFEVVAREWCSKQAWQPNTRELREARLATHLYPKIGAEKLNDVTAPALLAALRGVEAMGKYETAQRLLQMAARIFAYGIATGRCESNPGTALRGTLTTPKTVHRAAVTEPRRVGELLRAIDGYSGSHVAACALRLAPLVFVRPGELRAADWSEFDLAAAEWRIPASRMKMATEHLVPLSRQAVAILEELHDHTGPTGFVFPSVRTRSRPMSENTIGAALRRLGYESEEMTGHGFRTMASTLLNEQSWTPDAIERQLAHTPRNAVRAAYNRAQHLPERRQMMQAWADYLDGLRASANVMSLEA